MYKHSIVFCPRLKESRKSHGFTQKEVTDEIGTRHVNLSNYERGEVEPNIETLAQLADFYGISVDYLIGISSESPRAKTNKPFYKWNYKDWGPDSNWKGKKNRTACFPERIKIARARTKLSQKKVADIIGIPTSNIAKYELGKLKPSIETLARLCVFYDVRANWLLGLEDDPKFDEENK